MSIHRYFNEVLKEKQLTPSQLIILQEILKNPREYCLLNIQEFSEKVKVSQASTTRFIQASGFKKYTDFQVFLRESYLDISNLGKAYKYLNKEESKKLDFNENIAFEFHTIENFTKVFDEEILKEAVMHIAKATRIFLLGYGSSRALIEYLRYSLIRLGIKVIDLSSFGSLNEIIEESLDIDENDTIITIGFSGIYENLFHLTNCAKSLGAKTISFSGNPTSKVSVAADYVIQMARTDIDGFDSLVIPMMVLNQFILYLKQENKEKQQEMKEKLERLKSNFI